jgi:hypothetical protein
VGPSFYTFVPTTLALDPFQPWTWSSVTHTAADQHVDGWTDVEISSTGVQILDKYAITIDADSGSQAYTTWGFIFGDDPAEADYFPNIPSSANFIDHITNNLFSGYPGFYCNLTYSGGSESYELSQVMTPENLLSYDSNFYYWLQNTMGASQDLLDIEMFDGILTFTSINPPNTSIRPLQYTQSANLYFGWRSRDGINGDGTYSYLVYLGYEMTTRGDYDMNHAAYDSFFGYPEDVCLTLLYDQSR